MKVFTDHINARLFPVNTQKSFSQFNFLIDSLPLIKKAYLFSALLLCFCFFGLNSAYGKDYHYWRRDNPGPEPYPKTTTPQEACQYYYKNPGLFVAYSTYDGSLDSYTSPTVFQCTLYLTSEYYSQHVSQFATLFYVTQRCPDDTTLEFSTGYCSASAQKGVSDESSLCSDSSNPSSVKGDPVNAANGNNYQVETDVEVGSRHPIVIKRFYNSVDGIWRHSYSDFLTFADNEVDVVREDGQESAYTVSNGIYTSPTNSGNLSATPTGWTLAATDGRSYYFNNAGKLLEVSDSSGGRFDLTVDGDKLTITNNEGVSVTMTEDGWHQLKTLNSSYSSISYLMNMGRVEQVIKSVGASTTTRKYVYQDDNYYKNLLTGIVDERGVRFATWTYGGDGPTSRKTLTAEHAGGAEKTTFVYGDSSTTVTNELGKQLVFQFQTIHGAKRITAIQGQPSANCPASNSSYTYNDRGQVLTKTDAKGYITTYTYNDRGLEASRTEASGTPQSRTITTTWDPTRFLRTQIVEPDRTTVYSYDDQGRLINTQVTAR